MAPLHLLRPFFTVSGRLLPVLVGGLALLALTACNSSGPRISYDAPSSPDDEAFIKGVNRPASATTMFAMARMLLNQGRVAEAELVLRRALEQEPRFVPAYLELAEIAMRRQRVGDAAELLMAGLEIAPNDGRLLNNLGMCLLVRGEYEEALTLFTKAAANAPEDPRPRSNIATALGLMGRYDESLAAFSQLMPAAEAHYNLAILSEARADTQRAAQEMAIAAALDPQLADASRDRVPTTPQSVP